MAWGYRWRIDGWPKWKAILGALLERAAIEFPCEIIVRAERIPIAGWRRNLFHAMVSEVAPHWGLSPAEAKLRVKTDFYGAEVPIEPGRLTAEEVFELQRLLRKVGRYDVKVQSSEDSDDEEYERLCEHLILMAAESGFVISDRRPR